MTAEQQHDKDRDEAPRIGSGYRDWEWAAHRLGEMMCADGPKGYYLFTPQQLVDWASSLPSRTVPETGTNNAAEQPSTASLRGGPSQEGLRPGDAATAAPTGDTPRTDAEARAEAVIAAAERVSHLPSELCDFIREQAALLTEHRDNGRRLMESADGWKAEAERLRGIERALERANEEIASQSAIQPIHAAGDDGWTDWQKPTMRGYKMQCCDCGLVHETEFRIFKVEETPAPDEHYGHVVSPDDYRLQFRMKRGSGHQAPMKLWLWRNFVDGDPQYWAFESPFPTFENGDPITLGSPAGYAIVKPCADGRNGRTDESVIEEIKRVLAKTPLSTTPLISWLRDNAPDCGDNSCLFGGRGKGGMRTNGGCRCMSGLPTKQRIYVERMQAALSTASATGASIPYRATIKFDHETREVSGTLDLPVDTTVTK